MRLYRFDPQTRDYVGWVEVGGGQEQMYEGSIEHTPEEPPSKLGQWPKRVNGAWELVPDRRGTTWHDPATGSTLTITEAGVTPPAGWEPGFPSAREPTLEDLRDAKWEEIRTARNAAEKAGFPYMGKTLQSDEISVLRMTVAESAARKAKAEGLPYANVWTCADDSLLPLDADQQIGMLPALAAYGMQLHHHAQELRAQIYDPATTAEDLETIQWPF